MIRRDWALWFLFVAIGAFYTMLAVAICEAFMRH